MDYRGQALCETVNQVINVLFGVVGFAHGWYVQSFWITFLWCVAGLAVASLVCIPDWPIFNRHPLAWQPAELVPGTTETGVIVPDTNELCGTCACGASVHGIHCESHADNKDKAPQETEVIGSSPSPSVEIQEIKVAAKARGSKKK